MNQRWCMWTVGATVCLLTTVGLVPGCGGGGDSGGVNIPAQTFNNLPLNLGNGQNGTLNLTVRGNRANGVLIVTPKAAPAAARKATRAFSFVIPAGTYPVTGTFTAPREFSLQGTFPAPIGAFRLRIVLPTATVQGAYSLSAKGQNQTGAIPTAVPGTPTPDMTPTMTPTVTATATITPLPSGRDNITFTFTNDDAVAVQPLAPVPQSVGFVNPPQGQITAVFGDLSQGAFPRTMFSFELRGGGPLLRNKVFTLSGENAVEFRQRTTATSNEQDYKSTAGTLRVLDVRSIGDGRVTAVFRIDNALMRPQPGHTNEGTFTLAARGQVTGPIGGG